MHQPLRVNKFVTIYRGFTISKSPRTQQRPRNLYGISKDGLYYGCEFAEAEAIRSIDRLHENGTKINQADGRSVNE